MSEEDFTIQLSNQSQKFLDKSDEKTRERFFTVFDVIRENPYDGKSLRGNLSGMYSWRMGKYRIIYRLIEETLIIFVITIGLRKNIYK